MCHLLKNLILIYIAFQSTVELISGSFECDIRTRQGGRTKGQFYLRPLRDLPTSSRGTQDYPYFVDFVIVNDGQNHVPRI